MMDYAEVKQQIKEKLTVPKDFTDQENLLELGLNSLMTMRLVNQWRKQGVKVPFGELMEHPTFEQWWKMLKSGAEKKGKRQVKLPEQDMKKPFPLTDVQYAYWIGRKDDQVLGKIGCHAYLEFDGKGVDTGKLEAAWKQLQEHHPMLRACFLEDGTQVIMDQPYSDKIQIHDLTSATEEETEKTLQTIRERLSHRRLQVEEGQVAGLEITLLPEGKTRIHLDLDLLVADVQSLQLLLRDLSAAYAGKPLPDVSRDWNFASYLEQQLREELDEKTKAKEYWQGRLESLPGGPELPLAKRPEEITDTKFKRRIIKLEKEEWDKLQRRAAEYKTTPAVLLLAAYAMILERWSKNKRFLINIPFFNRNTQLQGLEEVIADFTTLLLLEVDCEGKPTFLDLLKRIQKRLHQDMKYTSYSGVQVQRDLAKLYGGQFVGAPIVFACNLGTPLVNAEFRDQLGEFSYMISQTPQVWNDFQTYEDESGLQLTWDSVDGLFPEGMIDDMLNSLEALLHELGNNTWNQQFDVMPRVQAEYIHASCAVGEPESPQCLHSSFLQKAAAHPEDIAVVDTGADISLTYQELKEQASAVAAGLAAKNLKEEAVAISLPRGYRQIIAALGILISGNIYVPVSCSQPGDRRRLIHEKTGVQFAITDDKMHRQLNWPENTTVLSLEELLLNPPLTQYPSVSPEDSAYIIMTSGSTGVPKGVEVLHKSAWNTIDDINSRCKISREDTALAVSALDFDLSVYDIFGILGAGGRLVLLPEEEKKNAAYWLKQIRKYHVSVWNSVPVLLDMLFVAAESAEERLPLRVVMLSGDWIGLDLPERADALTDGCRFIAMGGATEASIWSNYQEVMLPLPSHWNSIPYGRPLNFQSYRVIDANGRDCPYWVDGELWIGGYGLAKGYRGDDDLTKAKFVTDEWGCWYRTGDMGRLWKDGTIEFLGREDHQVKIRGHRIELGEIEQAIKGFPGVDHAVVDTLSDHGNKLLAAFVEAGLSGDSGVAVKKTGKALFEKQWDLLAGCTDEWRADDKQATEFEPFLQYANEESLQIMLKTFQAIGAFHSTNEAYTYLEILEKFKIAETQKNTIARWLDILNAEGVLNLEQGKYRLSNREDKLQPKRMKSLDEYLLKLEPHLSKMLLGEELALDVFYQKAPALAPGKLLQIFPGHEEHKRQLMECLRILAMDQEKAPLFILEIGTREPETTREFLNALENTNIAYTYADSSKYFLDIMKKELGEFEGLEFELLNPDESVEKQHFALHSYDLIIAWNCLHRNHDAAMAAAQIADLLSPSGALLMSELVAKTYLQELTAAFLENGFADISDERRETKSSVPSMEMWEGHLKKCGLCNGLVKKRLLGRAFLAVRQNDEVFEYEETGLIEYLMQKLPEYMVPKVYHFMEKLPVSSNGKIARNQLKETYGREHESLLKFARPSTMTETKMAEVWSKLFGFNVSDVEENYFAIGGDSLVATRLIAEIQKTFRSKISISTIFENPTIKSLSKVIAEGEKEAENEQLPLIHPNLEKEHEPFPLTDVQYAYWMGRSGLYALGNVATHCYFELDAEYLDIGRVQKSWNILVERHGMMRVIIQPDGQQRILEDVPEYHIDVTDIRECDETEKIKVLDTKREEMAHQVIQTEKWPLFDVQITKIADTQNRIHISFDNLIFDGWSMFHILGEWAKLYRGQDVGGNIGISFRDYVLSLEKIKGTTVYERDRKYWRDRILTLPPAPQLPIAKAESQIENQRFSRRSGKLNPKEWDALKKIAKAMAVTPSVLLISAYAETIRLWSSNKDFTINLTQFDRKPLHPSIQQLVGDFTTLTLLEVRDKKETTFSERTQAIQKQLMQDLEHSFYSAIEVERELKKQAGNSKGTIMPVVFTSGIGVEQWDEGKWLGKLNYNISQTPQVWLDHQVIEMDGNLCLFWDSVDELFYPGVLDEMFHAYVCILQKMANNPEMTEERQNTLVTAKISEKRLEANMTKMDFKVRTLDEMFMEAAQKYPDKEAVVTAGRRMTYHEIKDEALYICEHLQKEGILPEEPVAIVMEKGWEQVVAAYGVLFAGAAYLPLDIHNPQERIEEILRDSNTRIILTQPNTVCEKTWLKKWKCIPVCQMKADHMIHHKKNNAECLAYVIYTSGTTGKPKGVMISHHGAVNTIMGINDRFQITENDTVFGISNLSFDLSVYDIFGILGVGGKLVLPETEQVKNPADWLETLISEGATVWNSVPCFMEMLAEYEEHQKSFENTTIRLILMSGDWIPVTLPERIRNIFGDVKIIGLGGATEASIWSNYFEIPSEVPENWKSIPYGKPLANQKYYVLDPNMKNCPDWVPGMLYIAGAGVAQGYLNDQERTSEKFMLSDKYGERLYCTGDLGRYWKDGNIEFLGREDNQVKVNGYRIELGEIEGIISRYPNINKSIVIYVTEKNCLAGFYQSNCTIEEEGLTAYLRQHLPEYMIPRYLLLLRDFPKNHNGKTDRPSLERMAADYLKQETSKRKRTTSEDTVLISIWRDVLGYEEVSLEDDFFLFGGDSLRAIRLSNEINKNYDVEISVRDIFKYPTVLQLTQFIENKKRNCKKGYIHDIEEGFF